MKLLLLMMTIVILVVATNQLQSGHTKSIQGLLKTLQHYEKSIRAVRQFHTSAQSRARDSHRILMSHLHAVTKQNSPHTDRVAAAVPVERSAATCTAAIGALLADVKYSGCHTTAQKLFDPAITPAARTLLVTKFCTTDGCKATLDTHFKTITTECKLNRPSLLSTSGLKILNAAMYARTACLKVGNTNCLVNFYEAQAALANTDGSGLTDATLSKVCSPCTFKILRNIGKNSARTGSIVSAATSAFAKRQLRSFCRKRGGEFCITKFTKLANSILVDVVAAQQEIASSLTGTPDLAAIYKKLKPFLNKIMGALCHPCVQVAFKSFQSTNTGANINLAGFGPICLKQGGNYCINDLMAKDPIKFLSDAVSFSGLTPPCSNGVCDATCASFVNRYKSVGCCIKAFAAYARNPVLGEKIRNAFNVCDTNLPACNFGCDRTWLINATIQNFYCGTFDKAITKTRVCNDANLLFGGSRPCGTFNAVCDASLNTLNFEASGKYCSSDPTPLSDIKDPINSGEALAETEELTEPNDLDLPIVTLFVRGGLASALEMSGVLALVVLVTIALF